MYDYLREIPPGYKQEYKSLIDKFIPTNDSVKYQLIIMSYKEENFIGECVESLTNQTISPDEFEVLIINNCSYEEEFDNTESVVKEKLERYKYDNSLFGLITISCSNLNLASLNFFSLKRITPS